MTWPREREGTFFSSRVTRSGLVCIYESGQARRQNLDTRLLSLVRNEKEKGGKEGQHAFGAGLAELGGKKGDLFEMAIGNLLYQCSVTSNLQKSWRKVKAF